MTPERWHTLTFAQQMGNIGSEIARAKIFEGKGDLIQKDKALERAFELIDLTLEDARLYKRRKELARFREVAADWYAGTHAYLVSPQEIEDYCISFTLRPYLS